MSVIPETVVTFEVRKHPLAVRVVPKNETPQSKMQRVMSAGFREFAREYPTEALEIVRQEILDRRK